MPKNSDPDGDDVIELVIVRREIEVVMSADGLDQDEREVLDRFDAAFGRLTLRRRLREAFECLMRNGVSRYTRDGARDAGIAVLVDGDRQVRDVGFLSTLTAIESPEVQAA